MKKRNNNFDKKTRLICYDPTINGGNYYLCRWDAQDELWEENGGRKGIRDLFPLIEGNRYKFVVSKETRGKLLGVSASKKLSLLIKKFPLID